MPDPDDVELLPEDEEEDEPLDWDLDERDAFMAEHDNDDYEPDVAPLTVVEADE